MQASSRAFGLGQGGLHGGQAGLGLARERGLGLQRCLKGLGHGDAGGGQLAQVVGPGAEVGGHRGQDLGLRHLPQDLGLDGDDLLVFLVADVEPGLPWSRSGPGWWAGWRASD